MGRLERSILRAWSRTGLKPGLLYQRLSALDRDLGGGSPACTLLPNGMKIWCDLSGHIPRVVWGFGIYEPQEAWWFSRAIRPGWTVIDVGANIGQYSLMASSAVGTTGRVIALEPVPATFAMLERNVAANGLKNVTCARLALWSEPKTVHLANDRDGDPCTFGVAATGAVTAEAVRLDDFAREAGIDRVDLIKVDIEGGEPWMLRGASGLLAAHRPMILSEVNPEALAGLGATPGAIAEPLCGLGYRAWRMTDEGFKPVELAALDGLPLGNYLFAAGDVPEADLKVPPMKALLRWGRSGW